MSTFIGSEYSLETKDNEPTPLVAPYRIYRLRIPSIGIAIGVRVRPAYGSRPARMGDQHQSLSENNKNLITLTPACTFTRHVTVSTDCRHTTHTVDNTGTMFVSFTGVRYVRAACVYRFLGVEEFCCAMVGILSLMLVGIAVSGLGWFTGSLLRKGS